MLIDDAELNFFSVDFPEYCSLSTSYTLVNTTAQTTGDPPAKN